MKLRKKSYIPLIIFGLIVLAGVIGGTYYLEVWLHKSIKIINVLVLLTSIIFLVKFNKNLGGDKKYSFLKSFLLIAASQLVVVMLTLCFYEILNYLSEVNPRYQEVIKPNFIEQLVDNKYSLFLMPIVCYAISGIFIAYYSYTKNLLPWIPKQIVPNGYKHPEAFYYEIFNVIIGCCIALIVFNLVTFSIVGLLDIVSKIRLGETIFSHPLKVSFLPYVILPLVILFYKKIYYLSYKFKMPLSYMLFFFIFSFVALILVLEHYGNIFWSYYITNILPKEFKEVLFPERMPTILDKISVGYFTNQLKLIQWVWFLIFLPLMSSIIARVIGGYKVWQAFLLNLILPVIILLCLTFFDVTKINLSFEYNNILWFILSSGLILFIYGRVKDLKDLLYGFMPYDNENKTRGFVKMKEFLFFGLIGYFCAIGGLGYFAQGFFFSIIGIFISFFLIIYLPLMSYRFYKR